LGKSLHSDAGKFSFGNLVCDDWNRLPGWVVSAENVNEFKGNLDHYLKDNRGFKEVMITFFSLEPFALSSLLLAAVREPPQGVNSVKAPAPGHRHRVHEIGYM